MRGLDWLNFFLADVQSGVGPFLAIYLADNGWNQQKVGTVLTVGGIAGILAQAPSGALVDKLHAKRTLIAVALAILAAGSLLIAAFPSFWPVTFAQVLVGVASTIFGPAICAISLGLVGHQLFDRRQGRNQTFNSAGNVAAALAMGGIAYAISNRGIFFFVVALTIPTLISLFAIRKDEIDFERARGDSSDASAAAKPAAFTALLRDRKLVTFLLCAVLFHFANAAMLPLLGEMLAHGHGRSSMLFMSGCVVTTQVVVALGASLIGRLAGVWGRKPLLLVGFAAIPLRGVLYTLTHKTALLIAIQLLDGVGAAVFGVVSVLVIADLTRGTGRFNLTQGAIGAAVGTGAALSQVIAGSVAHLAGNNAAFLFLAAIAGVAFLALFFFMPDTLKSGGKPG